MCLICHLSTSEALEHSAAALQRIRDFVFELEKHPFPVGRTGAAASLIDTAKSGFLEGLGDDLNVSVALTALFDLIRGANTLIKDDRLKADDAREIAAGVYAIDEIPAVLPARQEDALSEDLRHKVEEREQARKDKNWPLADRLRKELLEAGVVLEDTKDGVRWKIVPRTGSR